MGLLLDCTKPSSEPMLTYHQRCFVVFILDQFHKKGSSVPNARRSKPRVPEPNGLIVNKIMSNALQWRHNDSNGVANHWSLDCLLNRLSKRRSKKTSRLRVTRLCEGNPPVTGGLPSQRASNSEYVSIWWRHGIIMRYYIHLNRQITQWQCNYNLETTFTSKIVSFTLQIQYIDVTTGIMVPQITGNWGVCSTVRLGSYQREYQSQRYRLFVRGIHRWRWRLKSPTFRLFT